MWITFSESMANWRAQGRYNVSVPFEKFTETAHRLNVSGSVSERGMLAFSAGARHRFQIDEKTLAVLYYDRERDQIAVELTPNEDAEGARKIVPQRTGATIRAKPFFDYFDIRVKGTLRMGLFTDEENGWVIFDLGRAKQALNSNRDHTAFR